MQASALKRYLNGLQCPRSASDNDPAHPLISIKHRRNREAIQAVASLEPNAPSGLGQSVERL